MATARQVAPFMSPAAVRRASDELRRQEDELQAATNAVLAEISQAQGDCDPSQLLQQLADQYGLSLGSIRAALWELLNSGEIMLTEERKLTLPEKVSSG